MLRSCYWITKKERMNLTDCLGMHIIRQSSWWRRWRSVEKEEDESWVLGKKWKGGRFGKTNKLRKMIFWDSLWTAPRQSFIFFYTYTPTSAQMLSKKKFLHASNKISQCVQGNMKQRGRRRWHLDIEDMDMWIWVIYGSMHAAI